MPVAVATRFKVGGRKHLPRFLKGAIAAALQARRSPGFVAGRLRVDSRGAYWTLTLWESGTAMAGYRDTGAHAQLVPKLAGWAREAVFGVWNTEEASLPSWDEASRHVAENPHFAPLDSPAPEQIARRFDAASRWGLVLPLPRSRTTRASRK